MKEYNVLILDDIKLIGKNIQNRIGKVNNSYYLLSGINIKPHYITIDIANVEIAVKNIEQFIEIEKIDYLLLDRGFSYIVESDIDALDNRFLYAVNKTGLMIDEVLKQISRKCYKRIKGIIIYTYNPNEESENKDVEIRKNIKMLINRTKITLYWPASDYNFFYSFQKQLRGVNLRKRTGVNLCGISTFHLTSLNTYHLYLH